MKYEIVIGLETHVRVGSVTKMFDAVPNAVALERDPNVNISPVSLGLPGALPVLSEGVVDLAVRAAHGLRMTVNQFSQFDRKSYFYPDLPMGYQITQLFHPIAEHGHLDAYVEGALKRFNVRRIHIECDAGKLTHSLTKTLCDYNRSGSPLMEIVTEPDFRSKDDVLDYLKELQKVMRFVGASDADMEKGQLRCDVNISLRLFGAHEYGNRVEIKNLNSFQMIGRAIDYEVARQAELYDSGVETIDQETRGWDDEKGESYPLRSKEDAMDYRYFPEPDLPPLHLTAEYIAERDISELPIDRRQKYLNEWGLLPDDSRILSSERAMSDFFEKTVALTNEPKKCASLILTVILWILKKSDEEIDFTALQITPESLARVVEMMKNDEISSTNAQEVVRTLLELGWDPDSIVEKKWLKQVNDMGTMEAIVDKVLSESAPQIADYQSGKVNLFGYFVGQCMKESKWVGNPKIFTDLVKKRLG